MAAKPGSGKIAKQFQNPKDLQNPEILQFAKSKDFATSEICRNTVSAKVQNEGIVSKDSPSHAGVRLVITEKAIAGRRIAEILAGKAVPAQAIGNAPAFFFERDGRPFIVVPLRGHIVDVDFPKQYSHWLGTDLKRLADAQIDYVATEHAIVSALRKVAKDADAVIVATDADREGEAIGREALTFLTEGRQGLEIKRAYFSAITPKDIGDAFSKLDEFNYALADSADARREIDLIWGAVLTRFISLVSGRLGKEFLSAGRVQTPVLAIIVDREKERLAFKSHKYWEALALLEKDSKQFEALHKKGKFLKKEEAEAVLARRSGTALVVDVKSAKRTLARPEPFNTTAFLRAATALGMDAGEAMNAAETLYQQGYTSYPRTDNAVYPATLDLRAVLNELNKVPELKKDSEKILALGTPNPSRGKETKDHPPIYPVSAAPRGKLSEREWRIYELIARRFLATLSEDAETLNQTVDLEIGKEPFVAHGQVITKAGWKEVYPYSTIKETHLPELRKGDIAKVLSVEMLEKETQPPARYSQGSLIKLMEELGLGTKSTRHEIIKKLYSRQYISGIKSIEPNKISFAVIDVLEKYSPTVTKPKMTAELESEMDLVADSKKTKGEVVGDSRKFLQQILGELVQNRAEIGNALRGAMREDSIMAKCPSCEGQLRIIMSRNRKRFLGCTSYPKCTTTFPLPQRGRVVPSEKPCDACGKPMIKVFGGRYRYEMCVDPNCISKADWGKKKAEREQAKAEKAKAAAKEQEGDAALQPAKSAVHAGKQVAWAAGVGAGEIGPVKSAAVNVVKQPPAKARKVRAKKETV